MSGLWGPYERTIRPCPWSSLPPQLLQMLGSCVAWFPVHLLLITQMVTVDRIFSQDCGAVVASKFFPIDGPDGKQQPLCERDYFRRLNLICAKCGFALRGSYVTACGEYLLSNTFVFTAYMAIRPKVPPRTFYVRHMSNTVWPRRFRL